MAQNERALVLRRPTGEPLRLSLEKAYVAEARVPDIAFVNSTTAPVLVSTFMEAADHLAKVHSKLEFECQRATIASRKRRAVLLLDEIPRMAKEKGLVTTRSPTGAADIRDAFLYTDDEFCRLEEFRAALEAARELVINKLFLMKSASNSCARLLTPESRPRSTALASGFQEADPDGALVERALEQHAVRAPSQSSASTDDWGIPK